MKNSIEELKDKIKKSPRAKTQKLGGGGGERKKT